MCKNQRSLALALSPSLIIAPQPPTLTFGSMMMIIRGYLQMGRFIVKFHNLKETELCMEHFGGTS